MKSILTMLLVVLPAISLDLRVELDSGLSGPVSSGDNDLYDPGVYIEPALSIGISPHNRLQASFSYLFASGGELTENTGIYGDVFSNYRSFSYALTVGLSRDIGFSVLEAGAGYRTFETERDLFGEWTAD